MSPIKCYCHFRGKKVFNSSLLTTTTTTTKIKLCQHEVVLCPRESPAGLKKETEYKFRVFLITIVTHYHFNGRFYKLSNCNRMTLQLLKNKFWRQQHDKFYYKKRNRETRKTFIFSLKVRYILQTTQQSILPCVSEIWTCLICLVFFNARLK